MKPLLAICGPTGSGKSSLAIALASGFDGEIINCDSLQVYRHFDIGTAKLPETERGGIPHHLIDAAEPCEGFTAGDFCLRARTVLAEIGERGKLPVIAGGTGFYLRALVDGLSPAPVRDAELRSRLQAREIRRPGSLHRILGRLDPASAVRIHSRDMPKIVRALEIRLLGAHAASRQPPRDPLLGYDVLKLALFPPREELYALLDARCAAMFTGGLLDEIESILARGVPETAKPFESLGYKEGLAYLRGRMNLGEAIEHAQRATRHYAKRQMTWFRREPRAIALCGFGGAAPVLEEARRLTGWLIDSDQCVSL